jgi:hypothetical protein
MFCLTVRKYDVPLSVLMSLKLSYADISSWEDKFLFMNHSTLQNWHFLKLFWRFNTGD